MIQYYITLCSTNSKIINVTQGQQGAFLFFRIHQL